MDGLRFSILVSTAWPGMILGSGLAAIATVAGWNLAAVSSLATVRLIAWWVRHLVRPLLACRSWSVRAAAIFLNNALILTVLVALGQWRWIGICATASLGLSLGIGLRLLSDDESTTVHLTPTADPGAIRRIRFGLGLNMLEPPAIMVAIGLSLGRQTIPLTGIEVWETFAIWVLPATVLAAAGESLWLGALVRSNPSDAQSPPRDSNDHAAP